MNSLGSIGERSSELKSNSPSQRPSYFDYSSTSGLYPPQHTFDEDVIKNLELELLDDTVTSDTTNNMTAEEEKLKTFLRIRPISDTCAKMSLEVKDEHTVVAYANPKLNVLLQDRGRKQSEFQFTKVLGPECGQSTVFEECVTPIIEKFLKHENCLIFSYGATNSGKTYTMQGHGTEYGIIPRTLDSIFSRIHDRQYKIGNIRPSLYQSFMHLNQQEIEALHEKRDRIIQDANIKQELMSSYRLTTSHCSDKSGSTVDLVGAGHCFDPNVMFTNTTLYSIWISYAELYNERVYDLLDSSTLGKNKRRKELRLMQDRNGFVYIKDLTEYPVTSDEEAYKLFLAGRKNLMFASTQMNQHSSRSHSFYTIRVVSIGVGEGAVPYPKTVHRMTFCDLAGMERANQTENRGFRLQESGNINNSLTVLLKVIRVLREKQTHNAMIETIPFRESKLTHIFKSYLTSATHICMLVNVNPHPAMAESTLQVLQNSAIASNVIVFRPMEINVQAEPDLRDVKRLVSKPPIPPNREAKVKKPIGEKRPLSHSESEESDSDGYGVETVVAPKTMLQKLKLLETENALLRARLAESEAEKNKIRDDMMNLLAEERLVWMNKLQQLRVSEEVYNRRRLSLVSTKVQLSPGSKCGRCSPPTRDMEDIDETFEEDEEVEEESDKENH